MMAGYMATSNKEDWLTPPELVAAVHAVLDGPPDLDPCSNPASVVGARRSIMLPADGLCASWAGARSMYVNPPFGRGLARWTGRCVDAAREGTTVLLLLPAAVDTRHWHDHVRTANFVCFLRGRVRFIGAKAGAPFAVALAIWTERRDVLVRFRATFGALGLVYGPPLPGGLVAASTPRQLAL